MAQSTIIIKTRHGHKWTLSEEQVRAIAELDVARIKNLAQRIAVGNTLFTCSCMVDQERLHYLDLFGPGSNFHLKYPFGVKYPLPDWLVQALKALPLWWPHPYWNVYPDDERYTLRRVAALADFAEVIFMCKSALEFFNALPENG